MLRVVPLAVILLPALGAALPQYAASTGRYCVTCHAAPSGGGLRNGHGEAFWAKLKRLERRKSDSPWSLQGDFRVLGLAQEGSGTALFPMEASLYGAYWQQDGVVVLHLNKTGRTQSYQAEEVFWQKDSPDGDWVFRLGRFDIPFGLQLEDHTAAVRRMVGLDFDAQDVGGEVSFTKEPFFAHAALMSGEGNTLFDLSRSKLFTIKVAGQLPWGGTVGLSYLRNSRQADKRNLYSFYGFGCKWGVCALKELVREHTEPAGQDRWRTAATVQVFKPTLPWRLQWDGWFPDGGDNVASFQQYTLTYRQPTREGYLELSYRHRHQPGTPAPNQVFAMYRMVLHAP